MKELVETNEHFRPVPLGNEKVEKLGAANRLSSLWDDKIFLEMRSTIHGIPIQQELNQDMSQTL